MMKKDSIEAWLLSKIALYLDIMDYLLTWPTNKKGKMKVKPLHIQDWKPSKQQERRAHF